MTGRTVLLLLAGWASVMIIGLSIIATYMEL